MYHNIDTVKNEENYLMSISNYNLEDLKIIIKDYIDGFCIQDIKDKYNINIKNYVKALNINRSNSESKKTKNYINKYEKTCLKNYNVKNPSQSNDIKKKKKETFIKNQGYENNFCNKEILDKALKNIDYDKVKKTTHINLQNKYGKHITNIAQVPEVRRKSSKSQKERFSKLTLDEKRKLTEIARSYITYTSKLELKIQEILNLLNIEYYCNVFLYRYNWDIVFKNKVILEINGDFWHANPNMYKANDILLGDKKAKDIWDKDKRKKNKAEANGYKVYYLWENEINNMSDEQIIKFLKSILC